MAETCSVAMRQEGRPPSTCTGCLSAQAGTSSGSTVASTRRWRHGWGGVQRAIYITPRSKSTSGRETFVIEQAPVHDWSGKQRGVVAEGAVGARWAGRFRIFRYEIRLWRNGHIPDVAEAVDSPRRLSNDGDRARRVLELVARIPTPVWGRDELETGDMWNSNSVIAWVIARSGIGTDLIQPPPGGRAPGWQAGLVVARRQEEEAARTARVEGVHKAP